MQRELLKYAPIYRNWYMLARAKDTAEKRAAFYEGILDYAFLGKIPPDPNEIPSPRGPDFARYDGYLTSQITLDGQLPKIIGGARGGASGRGEAKARRGAANGNSRPESNNEDTPAQGTLRSILAKVGCEGHASILRNEKEKEKEKEKENINRSVPVALTAVTVENGNENGTEVILPKIDSQLSALVKKFTAAVSIDEGAFFAAEHDVAVICAAVTSDYHSARRWRQLAKTKGEAAVREECFVFWREIAAGEEPKSRGAALNARLARLPDSGEIRANSRL